MNVAAFFTTRERNQRIVDAYRQGLPSAVVAERFGMGKTQVRRILRLYGVSRPVGRPRRAA